MLISPRSFNWTSRRIDIVGARVGRHDIKSRTISCVNHFSAADQALKWSSIYGMAKQYLPSFIAITVDPSWLQSLRLINPITLGFSLDVGSVVQSRRRGKV